jgi:DNA repair exonuclease SbcCD ATPase subunit
VRELNFRYAFAKNLLCFGEEGIKIYFGDYGNLIKITGTNHDLEGSGNEPCDNAVGKSTTPEIISVGLFGRTIKSPTKLKGGKVIHDGATSDCVIEVQWDEYRVQRTIKLNGTTKLQMWKSVDHIWDEESELDKGKVDIQAEIERVLGLSHNAFCGIFIFDDEDKYSFLEAGAPAKREIVENVLGLDRYREYHETAKSLLKSAKENVEKIASGYERSKIELETAIARVKRVKDQDTNWRTQRTSEIAALEVQIKSKQSSLEKTDANDLLVKYQQSQEQIQNLQIVNTDLQEKRSKLAELATVAKQKFDTGRAARDEFQSNLQQRHLRIQALKNDLIRAEKLVGELHGLQEGAKCPICYGVIKSENYNTVLAHSSNVIEGCRSSIDKESLLIEADKLEFGNKSAAVSKVEEVIKEAHKKIGLIDAKLTENQGVISKLSQIPKPDINAAQQVLEAEITHLRKQLKDKQDESSGDSPYKEIIRDAIQEQCDKELLIKDKEKELKVSEEDLPYYEFWVKSFGDKGIRKYIVDGVIPALNSKVAYWLHYLIDGKIELNFDNQLEEHIERNGRTTEYCGLSKSEKRRVNLAVSQAFAHVMMLNSGCCPNVIFLDEITGGGVDATGISGVANMIFELAKERQVFVTTHDERLLSMLQGCEVLNLEKRDDVTILLAT